MMVQRCFFRFNLAYASVSVERLLSLHDLHSIFSFTACESVVVSSPCEEFYHFLDRDGDGIDMYEFVDYVQRVRKTKKTLGAQNMAQTSSGPLFRRKQRTFKDQLVQDLENGGRSMPNLNLTASFVNVGRQKRPTNRFAASGMSTLA